MASVAVRRQQCCVFFLWHDACKERGAGPGVLAHPPLLPTASAPGRHFLPMRIKWDQLFGFSVPPLELVAW